MITLAVVPIFITAGSAVLPTVLAAVAGGAAIVLRPRDLLRMIDRHRTVTIAGMAVALLATGLAWQWTTARNARGVAASTAIDWAAVARQIIARDQANIPAAVPASQPITTTAVIEGRDATRASFDGGPAPRNLRPLWTYAPEDTMFLATPAAAGDRIFVAGCVSDLSNYTGRLACLDAATGRVIWDVTDVDGEPLKALFSSPAVTADGRCVIVGQGFHQDRDCALVCFDAGTGKPRWSAKSTEHIESSPAIFGDMAVVGVGAIEDKSGRATGDTGHVMAVRISDGLVLWQQPVIDAESSPAIADDGTTYVGSGLNGNAVIAIEPTGKPLWKTEVGLSVTGTVSLAGDRVIVGAGNGDFVHSNGRPEGAVIALDRRTGAIRWRAHCDDGVLGPVAVSDGRAYAPVRSGEIIALDTADGKMIWKQAVSGASPVLAGCAVAGDAVYALAADGTLAVLDKADGHVIEKHAANDPAKADVGLSSAAPQVAGGRVIVGTETGGVRCFVGGKATP